MKRRVSLLVLFFIILGTAFVMGDTTSKGKRLLLIGQGPDGHPAGTHEFMAGVRILARCLQ